MGLKLSILKRSILTFLLVLLTFPASKEAVAAQLALTWADNSTNEDGFAIQRRTGTTGTFTQIAIVGPNVTFYTDTGLADKTTYCYRVAAFNQTGYSPYSNDRCGTTPAAMVLLTVTKTGSGSGTVSSTPSGINCGSACLGSYLSGTSVTLTATPEPNSTFAGWSGGGCSGTGSCTWTLTANTSVTASFDKLLASTEETVAAQLALAWTDNSSNEDGFAIQRRTGTTGTFTQIAIVGPNVTSYTDTGLADKTTYCYRVAAFNQAGYSPYSNDRCGTTPEAILVLTLTNTGSDSGTISSLTADTSVIDTSVTAFTQIWPASIGIFRPETGEWYLDLNGNGVWDGVKAGDRLLGPLGGKTDLPVTGHWTGTQIAMIGVFDPRRARWHLDRNGNGILDGCERRDCVHTFGLRGDLPVVGDWIGAGVDMLGVFRPSTGEWELDLNGNGLFDGCEVDGCLGPFGLPRDLPVVGKW